MKTTFIILFCILVSSAYAQRIDDLNEIQTIRLKNGQTLYLPTLVTPNGDGLNDTWNIGWTSGFKPYLYEIQLFDSMGPVASFSPVGSFWNGKNLKNGTYRFLLYHQDIEEPLGSGEVAINRFRTINR